MSKKFDGISAVILVAPAGHFPLVNLGWRVAMRILKYLGSIFRNGSVKIEEDDAKALLFNRVEGPHCQQHWLRLVGENGLTLLWAIVWPGWRARLKKPALVIRGRHDHMVPLYTQRLVAWYHRATVIDFDLGHMIPLEDRDGRVWRAIEEWLEEVTNE